MIEEKYINMCYTVQTVVGNGGCKTKCNRIKNPSKYMCGRCDTTLKSERGFI